MSGLVYSYATCIGAVNFHEIIFVIFCIFRYCCTFLMGISFKPPHKRRDKAVLSKEEIWSRKFDACVKKALIQELKYRKRSMKNQRNHFVNFSELSYLEEQRFCVEDTYSVENFRKTIETRLFDAVICNELLYEALQVLTPSNLEILLLKYWGGMTDLEIGHLVNMSQQMVNYHRSKSLKRLKTVIEEMTKNDQRFRF
mgnify:CR=1 FL=1